MSAPSPRPGWSRWTGRVALVFGLLGLVARGVGDRTIPLAVLHYASPWLVTLLAGTWALATIRGAWRAGGLLLVLAGTAGGIRSWSGGGPPSMPMEEIANGFTATTWNAGRDLAGNPAAWRFDAEVVAVVESGSFDDATWKAFVDTDPTLTWCRLDGGTLLGVRGRIGEHDEFSRHGRFRCHRTRVRLGRGGDLTVVVMDIRSQPWLSREEAIRTGFEVAGWGPAIVLGDFNTPPDSRWFDDFAGGYTLANRARTHGFLETWGWGVPLLTLDQIWLSTGLVPVEARQEARGSDHRLVETRILRIPSGD